MRKLIILLILIMMAQPSFAAGSKTYSADLPTAGRQRSPVALTTLFNEILTWLNDIFEGTGDASSLNQALVSEGNGDIGLSNVFRSDVDLLNTTGNGTLGQILSSNGDGTVEWIGVNGVLTDGDKGDITVSASGATWIVDNGVIADENISGVDLAKIDNLGNLSVIARAVPDTDPVSYTLFEHLFVNFTQDTIYPKGTRTYLVDYSYSGIGGTRIQAANTVAEKSILGTGGSFSYASLSDWSGGPGGDTITANVGDVISDNADGNTYRVQAMGSFSKTGSPTARLKLKVGGVDICDTGAVTMNSTATDGVIKVDGLFQIGDENGAATVMTGNIIATIAFNGETFSFGDYNVAGSTVDTTSNMDVDMTWTWGTASASNNVEFSTVTLERLY